jgi:anti-sigma factor RsiW
MRRRPEHAETDEEELAALADRSVRPDRRAALEERVEGSSELAGRLAEQERAVALFQGAAAEVEAPADLRARIEAQRGARRVSRRRRYVLIATAATAATAVAASAVVFVVVGSGTSGQRFHAALAPYGTARLEQTSSGWRIELDAKKLPRLDDGRFYQAWLKNDAGVLVPIGSFNEGENVTLWAGVSPKEFGTISVTRERADGDQSSSGDKVLVGRVEPGR